MAISIPALVDSRLVTLLASMRPVQDGATNIASSAHLPLPDSNRVADMLHLLTGLVDSGTLTAAGAHGVADSTNVLTAVTAADLSTSIDLADDLRTQYEAHRVRTTGGCHGGADAANPISAAAVTAPLTALLALVNELATEYEDHRVITGGGEHGAADSTNVITATSPATDLEEAIDLVNDVASMYAAHRVLTAGTVHGSADSTNVVTAPLATTLDNATTRATDIKLRYEAHRVRTASACHGAADSTNVITEDSGVDLLADAITLANELRTDYAAHRIYTTGSTHSGADTTNANSADASSTLPTLITLLNSLATAYAAHCAAVVGTTTSVRDSNAFGIKSMVGCKAVFTGNTTADLTGASAYVRSNNADQLVFMTALPAAPVATDTFTLQFAPVDKDLVILEGGKGLGDSQSNPVPSVPSLVNAMMVTISQLGGAIPSWMTEAFTKQTNAGAYGHGMSILLAAGLQLVRDTVAAYTKPS